MSHASTEGTTGLPQGHQFAHYRVLSLLGAGGMGQVYLAEDTRLKRRVALKILPSEFTQDEERLRRFQQEAQSASALNHPNILMIFDIGEAEATHYIATEFIEGNTLRQHMANTRMNLRETSGVSIQIASALASAHAAGIIHRDIKPENVMLRPDGYVKVLDFGLAKLVEPQSSTIETEAPTIANVVTEPGKIIGTIAYMSPEQVRGLAVDARSDIFSLGVVIYEMVSGRHPFSGETASDLIASILTTNPASLERYSSDISPKVQWIVSKALCKDRDERYQTAKELLGDLKNLSRELDVQEELERSVTSESRNSAITESAQAASGSNASMADRATRTSSKGLITGEFKQRKIAAVIALSVIVLSIVGIFAYLRATRAEGAIESIAVLPFDNQNNDPEMEYRSDGLTESIINSLTQLQPLRVIARSSAFRYKGRELDPVAVGRELGVRAVVTGRIMQRGNNLNIGVELIDVSQNKQLWGERYERGVSELLAVQREIAKEISNNLRLKLSGADQLRLTKNYTDNAEAYQLYLKGRYYWNKRTEEGLRKGIEYFQNAIGRDPNYALAYSGLADCYNSFGFSFDVGSLPPSDAIPKAKAAAAKALEIDDTLAEAHTSLAYTKQLYDWDWSGADREFKRAFELNPNYVNAHHWYSHYLAALGRAQESLAESKRSLELAPLDLIINTHLGWNYIFVRQYDLAVEQLRKTLEMDPNYGLTHWYLGMAYELKGMYPEAAPEFLKAIEILKGNTVVETDMGHFYAVSGKKGEAQKIIEKSREISGQKYVSSYQIALIYTGLGERDQAFDWFERAYREHSDLLVYLKVDPRLESLRSDSRFADLVRRVGL